jgi:hypothetical protein
MILKTRIFITIFFICINLFGNSCGIYSLTGANVQGKTINIHFIENVSGNVAPKLSGVLTEKIRNKILNQTTLSNSNAFDADYDLSGQITSYTVNVAAVSTADISSKNRLTISVEIKFENKLDAKNSWEQTFSKFADFNSSQNLQSVESQLMEEICVELADQIFAKAFVNW